MNQQNDQRRYHRHEISGEIEAYLQGSNTKVGKLVNVHREGLLLECPRALIPEQIYNLRFTMTGEVTMPWIELDAKCLWMAREDNGFRCGCLIVDIERQALTVLRQLDL
ncbi:PilZ domain-containing protein [Porticoccus sp. W117]|uniref:PilZ domain-containing protein n=1 Tax=Porticoccus sp. W117 TaxID=3054777 RepID=UPI0025915B6F|nr:PilZ domain-containing protein [Porticoccus sp. W117]MDM3870496.1 PilZ domain-containing protein [Porticoccus sp. W117]